MRAARVSCGHCRNTYETAGALLDRSNLTDNGVVYTARFVGSKNAFEYVLPVLGVKHEYGSPGHSHKFAKSAILGGSRARLPIAHCLD